MRSALRFASLVAAPALAALVFACSSAPPLQRGSSIDDEDEDNDSQRNENLNSVKPVTDAAPPPPPPPVDAGVPVVPDAGTPTPQSCPQLSACCGRLTDYLDRLACIGVALADDPAVCQPALVVCSGGGVGIGGFFDGTGGGACSELAGCCRQMQQRGDQAAFSCEKWVQYNDDTECYYTHQDYRQQRRCN